MNGVEILSQETIYNTILPEWCIAVGLLCAMTCIVVLILNFIDGHKTIGTVFCMFGVISVIVVCLGGTDSKTNISHIEYKVIIDNSVSMNEFLDKYEILDHEGKIYTIREK